MVTIKDSFPKYNGLKGQLHLAQGNTLGVSQIISLRPVRAAALSVEIPCLSYVAALTGRKMFKCQMPRVLPWAVEQLPLQGAIACKFLTDKYKFKVDKLKAIA